MTVRRLLAVATAVAVAAVAAPSAGAMPAVDRHAAPATTTAARVPDAATRRWMAYQQTVTGTAPAPAARPKPAIATDDGGVSPFAAWLVIAGALFLIITAA